MAEFYERLQEAMRESNITQTELCMRSGIKKSAMCQYVAGKFKPKQDNTYKIAKALNVSEGWLMGYDCDKHRKPLNSSMKILEKSDLSEAQRVQKVANNINNMSDKDVEKANKYLKMVAHWDK